MIFNVKLWTIQKYEKSNLLADFAWTTSIKIFPKEKPLRKKILLNRFYLWSRGSFFMGTLVDTCQNFLKSFFGRTNVAFFGHRKSTNKPHQHIKSWAWNFPWNVTKQNLQIITISRSNQVFLRVYTNVRSCNLHGKSQKRPLVCHQCRKFPLRKILKGFVGQYHSELTYKITLLGKITQDFSSMIFFLGSSNCKFKNIANNAQVPKLTRGWPHHRKHFQFQCHRRRRRRRFHQWSVQKITIVVAQR